MTNPRDSDPDDYYRGIAFGFCIGVAFTVLFGGLLIAAGILR